MAATPDDNAEDPTRRFEEEPEELAPTRLAPSGAARSGTTGAPFEEDDERVDQLVQRGTFGKYQVFELIGQGGFGRVYRGLDPALGRQVAIKTCTSRDAKLRQRFLREGKIAAGLQHTHVVTVHDLGYEGDLPFLVQEFVPGEDLSRLIAREDDLPLAEKLDILTQIARGLAHAHQQGVLHRDIKPANIRRRPDGQIKILDFGIARLADDGHTVTTEGVAVGTLGYLSPEQLASEPVDARADIFSFGVVAYELLGRRRPFVGETVSQVLYQLLYAEPPSLLTLRSDCPAELAALVHRCLNKKAVDRPASFGEVLQELARIGGPASGEVRVGETPSSSSAVLPRVEPGVEPGVSPTGSLPQGSRSRAGWIIPVGIAVLVALLVAVAFAWRKDPAPATENTPQITGVAAVPAAPTVAPPVPSPPPNAEPRANPVTPKVEPPKSAGKPPVVAETRPTTGPAQEPILKPAGLPTGSPTGAPAGSPAVAAPPPTESRTAAGENTEPVPAPAAQPSPVAEPPAAANPKTDASPVPAPPPPAEKVAAERKPPRLVQRADPVYPDLARRRKQEGTVVVGVYVEKNGSVSRTLIKSCSLPGVGFEEAARAAALRATFEPAQENGEPVRAWTEIAFEFRQPR